MLRSPPHISAVLRHGGVRYVAPHNPMQGSFFLPAARLACVLRKIERQGAFGADWRALPPQPHVNGVPRWPTKTPRPPFTALASRLSFRLAVPLSDPGSTLPPSVPPDAI